MYYCDKVDPENSKPNIILYNNQIIELLCKKRRPNQQRKDAISAFLAERHFTTIKSAKKKTSILNI